MIIKIKTNGHQHFSEIVGEVVRWCDAVEYYDGKPFTVSAVLMRTADKILLITLQKHLLWTEIEVLPDALPVESTGGTDG